MSVWAGRDNDNILRSNRGYYAGGEDKLLPSLANVNDVDSYR